VAKSYGSSRVKISCGGHRPSRQDEVARPAEPSKARYFNWIDLADKVASELRSVGVDGKSCNTL
jgi:hypothetical protein